ncbi:hypothetical protein ACE7GA_04700 [Roseomonas sp. CCTCC AB2023176]|uniref:hypothetical protein n=1 Tax=Roseomonas sp. CCTCC AB2023176 TaxID=3342640 RepID=UPI0035E0E1A6
MASDQLGADQPKNLGDDAPQDLSHAGSVTDKAIEYMIEQGIAPISIASALLGGALGLMAKTMEDRAIANVLRSALASVEGGELRSMRDGNA